MRLVAGADLRRPEFREETWHRQYTLHLRHKSHPGGVYYALPAMAEAYGWDAEQRAWCAFLNGNTQNPVTTLLLMEAGDRPERAGDVLAFWKARYNQLAWDTDRRYHKARLDVAIDGYLALTHNGQRRYWSSAARGGWPACWAAATAIPTMGRLSAWSYLEYVRLLDVANVPDADTLLLRDLGGSRSHRNGLCLLLGLDEWVWWKPNPNFAGHYPPELLDELETQGERLLAEGRRRNPDQPDVGYLTLESALCTWKSWHRPRRRYPGVYNDLLYDRIRQGEGRFGWRFSVLWQARRDALPAYLRLEDNPLDPGAVTVKQNHYLNTGQTPVLGHVWPEMWSDFDQGVVDGRFGLREDLAA
uniref:ADDT family thymidine hypermodification transferase n=1 Tax=Pseudonocardia sp. CA-138482 TaxID=3240023 RepID=UPI003F4953C5